MTVDRIWYILGKKLSGEASPEELQELEQMLRLHPELHYPVQNITDLWRLKKKINREETLESLQKHLSRMGEQEGEMPSFTVSGIEEGLTPGMLRRNRKSLLYAAAAILLFTISYYLFSNQPAAKENIALKQEVSSPNAVAGSKNEVSTRAGSHSKVVLPDGSSVWLNAGSKLEYDKNFDKEIREVALEGEAYFDVTKDPSRPFVIHTQKFNIKVLGTAFNVKSYKGDKSSETSLIHGSIEVTMKDHPEQKIMLKPADKLVVLNDDMQLISPDKKGAKQPQVVMSKINYFDSSIIETSWVENRLIFRNEAFAELAVDMERKYGMRFRFENEEAKLLTFDGNFKNETVNQALQALQLANYFSYTIENETIVITK